MSNFMNDPVSLAGLISLSNNMPFGNALVAAATQVRQNELVNLEQQKFAQQQKILEQQRKMQELMPLLAKELDLNDIQGSFQKLSQIMPAAEAAKVLSQLAKARPQDDKAKQSLYQNMKTGDTFLTEQKDGQILGVKPIDLYNFEGQLTKEDLGAPNSSSPKRNSIEEKYPLIENYRPPETQPKMTIAKVAQSKEIQKKKAEIEKKAENINESIKDIQTFREMSKKFKVGAFAKTRVATGKVGKALLGNDFGIHPEAAEVMEKITGRISGQLARALEGGNNRITDNIIEYARAQTPNITSEPEAAAFIANSFEKAFKTLKAKPKAFNFYVSTFGDDDGFVDAWNDYIEQLDERIIEDRKPTFKDYLQGKMAPVNSGATSMSTEELLRIVEGQ